MSSSPRIALTLCLGLFCFGISVKPAVAVNHDICGGSPLKLEDNIGQRMNMRGAKAVLSVVAIAQIRQTGNASLVGWYYLDDAGRVSALLKSNATALIQSAFGVRRDPRFSAIGPFLVAKSLPSGFQLTRC